MYIIQIWLFQTILIAWFEVRYKTVIFFKKADCFCTQLWYDKKTEQMFVEIFLNNEIKFPGLEKTI